MSWDTTTPSVSNYLSANYSGIPKTYPFTVALWLNLQPNTDLQVSWTLGDTATDGDHIGMRYRSSGTKQQAMGWDGTRGPGNERVVPGTLLGTWHLLVYVGTSSTDRDLQIDDDTIDTNTLAYTFVDPATNGTLYLGVDLNDSWLWDGYTGYAVVYDRALTQAEWQSLYVSSEKGVHPAHVAEDAIIGVWPLVDDEKVAYGLGTDLTKTGSIAWDANENPTIINRITRHNFASF